MKRRSPWLAFAACMLVRGSLALAEPMEKPALSISGASVAAEGELQKRGLAGDHVIASVMLVRKEGEPSYYTARIEPPVSADGKPVQAAPTAQAADGPGPAVLALNIAMNGNVTATEQPLYRRIRVLNSSK